MCLWCNLPLRLFPLLLFPSPVAATSCRVGTGDDFVCWLVGWKLSQGLCYTTGMPGKLLSLVPWNGLQWLHCRLFSNLRFWTATFLLGVEFLLFASISLTGSFHFARTLASVDPLLVLKKLKRLQSLKAPALTSCCAATTDPVLVWHLAVHTSREMEKLQGINFLEESIHTNQDNHIFFLNFGGI